LRPPPPRQPPSPPRPLPSPPPPPPPAYASPHNTHNADSTLLHTPPPQSEFLKPVYTPAKVETLETLIDSQDNLMALKQEFDLPLTTEVLKKKIKVTPAVRTESVTITLAWGDPATAAAMLNRLAELH